VTNCCTIVFFELTWPASRPKFAFKEAEFSWEEGLPHLVSLLTAPVSVLGLRAPVVCDGLKLQCKKVIASSSFAAVFETASGEIWKDFEMNDFFVENEIKFLKALAGANVPQLLASNDDGFLMTNCGFDISIIEINSLKETHIHDWINTLKIASEQKIVHLDIRPENLTIRGSHGYIIDWAFATTEGSSALRDNKYYGTQLYASPVILESLIFRENVQASASNDLRALVRVLYSVVTGKQFEYSQKRDRLLELDTFWKEHLTGEWHWSDRFAELKKFEELKNSLSKLVCN
jgi:hypothetical protein